MNVFVHRTMALRQGIWLHKTVIHTALDVRNVVLMRRQVAQKVCHNRYEPRKSYKKLSGFTSVMIHGVYICYCRFDVIIKME